MSIIGNARLPLEPHPHWCAPDLCIPGGAPEDLLHRRVTEEWAFTDPADVVTDCRLSLFGTTSPVIELEYDPHDHVPGLLFGIAAGRDLARRILELCDVADPDTRFVVPGVEYVRHDGGGCSAR